MFWYDENKIKPREYKIRRPDALHMFPKIIIILSYFSRIENGRS